MEFKIKRGEQEFLAPTLEHLRDWGNGGKLAVDDLIYHPTLERWFYAREMPELEGVWSTKKKAELNRSSWILAGCSVIVMMFSPVLGGALFLVAICMAVYYHTKR